MSEAANTEVSSSLGYADRNCLRKSWTRSGESFDTGAHATGSAGGGAEDGDTAWRQWACRRRTQAAAGVTGEVQSQESDGI